MRQKYKTLTAGTLAAVSATIGSYAFGWVFSYPSLITIAVVVPVVVLVGWFVKWFTGKFSTFDAPAVRGTILGTSVLFGAVLAVLTSGALGTRGRIYIGLLTFGAALIGSVWLKQFRAAARSPQLSGPRDGYVSALVVMGLSILFVGTAAMFIAREDVLATIAIPVGLLFNAAAIVLTKALRERKSLALIVAAVLTIFLLPYFIAEGHTVLILVMAAGLVAVASLSFWRWSRLAQQQSTGLEKMIMGSRSAAQGSFPAIVESAAILVEKELGEKELASKRVPIRGVPWTPRGTQKGDLSAPHPDDVRNQKRQEPIAEPVPGNYDVEVGQVQGFRERSESRPGGIMKYIWRFRVVRHRSDGERMPVVTVEMQGKGFLGVISDGDTVRIRNAPAKGGLVRISTLENLTDGSIVRTVGPGALEGMFNVFANGVALIVVVVVILLVVGFIAKIIR
jgi:hypothetical protein